METSNHYNVNTLDLPDEVLLAIFNKLDMVDVFYSLVYANKRFNRLTIDPFYIHNVDLTIKRSLLQQVSPLDTLKIDTICKNILARIHHHIYKLTVPSYLIECISNIHYPQLQSLSLVNFEEQKLLEYLTGNVRFNHKNIKNLRHKLIIIFFVGESTVYRLLINQIKHLNVDIVYDKNEANIFLLIVSLGKHLTDLMFHNQFLSEHLANPTFVLSSIHISSTLTKLTINVTTFDDCLYLLDGSLQFLTALIIDIIRISEQSSIIDNTVILSSIIVYEKNTVLIIFFIYLEETS
jgi:hypothetical protein